MILDLDRFVVAERPHWNKLEKTLDWLTENPDRELSIADLERFHALYQRASADLAKVAALAAEGELKKYLEWLVARAYAEIHEARDRRRFRPWRWLTVEFPRAFRRHVRAFELAVALTLAGAAFGSLALRIDADAKSVIMPFPELQNETPAQRVAREQKLQGKQLAGLKTRFSAQLMTHNTQVSLFTLALGITFGFGTLVILFYNGVILGAVAYDYIHGGQLIFLLGWLLPHGVIEIPAILIGGQTGFVIAHALIGWGSRVSRTDRLRAILPDVVTLAGGLALMLVWAGMVESFLSQYHEPVLPYSLKIAFGLTEAALLTLFLTRSGREAEK
ncbi:MAG TPA: stage II sporulation protein M [Bryobacteraceae bacterium]|nr:stage II sporulation protein M [Bryobacteraceae bacterium]